uniref:Uncharacterized protein n=1 Tax=Grammatophora oceanica TaxID=210454 RepID=A0A7S1VNX6_9STRA|mmetsp:Transcript_50459/g.75417  ORF Transcript_50459/g.75417 Transcript_50459/m.75417 type:complete len:354 (+) Transcript_50459:130-1191(+)
MHRCWAGRIAILLICSGNYLVADAFSPARQASRTCTTSALGRNSGVHALPPTTEEEKKAQKEAFLQEETFGGFTVKQRLREEVESPFRQVRLFFFASTAGSALTALYFSALSALKASIGGYEDAPPLNEALQTCGINIAGVIVCSILAYREWNIGNANLARIAKGGALAKLEVFPASSSTQERTPLASYRRSSRVLIAAGGPEYISQLARSLNSDQLADDNVLPERLEEVDVVVVPVLLTTGNQVATDLQEQWKAVEAQEGDRNFDIARANRVVAFPTGAGAWESYLESEIETAEKQGFDYMNKGLTITVKKNGKVLRRATGQPQWGYLIGAMETLDGSKFGMPGDSEKYGGP